MSVGGLPPITPRATTATSTAATSAIGAASSTQAAASLSTPAFKNDATLNAVARGEQTLEKGARGDAVKAVQLAFRRLGADLGRWGADGIYGTGTQNLVATFQRQNGLTPSGNVDRDTLVALDGKLAALPKPVNPNADKSIVMVGMNEGSAFEARELRKVAREGVTHIGDSKAGDDKVTIPVKEGGRTVQKTFDLATDAGRNDYVAAIGVTGAQATKLKGILAEAGGDARDEVGQLARVFAQAENGDRQIERLILSGHSVGSGVWGDNNGYFRMDLLSKLADTFPNAVRQVEDLHIAGCYSGGESAVDKWRGIFPNSKTVWAYGDSAPGSYTGAVKHLQKWEAATRGVGQDPAKLTRDLVRGTRKGENVAVWNAVRGLDNGEAPKPFSQLRGEFDRRRPAFDEHFNGRSTVDNPQSGPLRDYYNSMQRLLQSRELPAGERPGLEAQRDQTIRLIYYNATVKGKFQAAHSPAIRAGYEKLGLVPPDFSTLSRADALKAISEFQNKLNGTRTKPPEAERLLPLLTDGLRDLKSNVIPEAWV